MWTENEETTREMRNRVTQRKAVCAFSALVPAQWRPHRIKLKMETLLLKSLNCYLLMLLR